MHKPGPASEPDPMSGIVDRLLAQLPGLQGDFRPVKATASPGTSWAVSTVTASPSSSEVGWLKAWARAGLALTLAVTLAWWPYQHNCGLPLLGYLGAVVTVIVAGEWAAVSGWKHRIALAHLIALIVVLYGIVLGTAELLPRTGYAAQQATWSCLGP